MSGEYLDSTHAQIRDVIQRLQSPITDLTTLYGILAAPLQFLDILPPRFYQYSTNPLPPRGLSFAKHIPSLQRALLEHVLPAWGPVLEQEGTYAIIQQYFSPDIFSSSKLAARMIAAYAYSTILTLPLTEHAVRLLVLLVKFYPVDVLWGTVVREQESPRLSKNAIRWEDCVKDVCAVPGKVANAFGAHLKAPDIPPELEFGAYFSNVSIRFETLLSSLQGHLSQNDLASLSYLLTKLVNIGVFPVNVPSSPAQPSFWQVILPAIRAELPSTSYDAPWSSVLAAVSSAVTSQSIAVSLFSHLDAGVLPHDWMQDTGETPGKVKREALLLCRLLGPFSKENDNCEVALSAAVDRQWTMIHARVYVAWACGAGVGKKESQGLQLFLDRVTDVWTAPDHIKHSLLAHHQYLTALLLLTMSNFPKNSISGASKLASSPAFIRSISTYISHLDASVRRCGMLVAEEVAHICGKKLDFGDWDGDSEGRAWCRSMRKLMKERDSDAEIVFQSEGPIQENPAMAEGNERTSVAEELAKPNIQGTQVEYEVDSDDESLVGYASSEASFISSSSQFTPAELEEIEKDPTLNIGRQKVPRPVYLGQLGELVRPTSGVKSEEENLQVVRMEVALEVGEELIRRKSAYGTELEENAVNLTYGFAALQDNYDIEGFNEKRQAALTALVACCPKKAAPALIEQFFMAQYSAEQRYAMLNALALGARELASLPVPGSALEAKRIGFPSKRLPATLHQQYITANDQLAANPVQNMLEGLTRRAIESGKEAAEDKVPEVVRERRLRINQSSKVAEVHKTSALATDFRSMQLQPQPIVAFTEVAAEYFICPMINRFWQFLREEQAREARTAHLPNASRYRGAATGLVLNTFVLAQFIATLAVLVHAAHNAPEWLAVLAPDALELAVTVGTRPLSQSEGLEDDEEDMGNQAKSGRGGKEAALLTNSLELATVVVDGCLELDDGKSLGLEHTALLFGAGEWGTQTLSRLEKGVKVLGGGGKQEVQLRRAAAGLVLKIDEVTTRWRRSMVAVGYETL